MKHQSNVRKIRLGLGLLLAGVLMLTMLPNPYAFAADANTNQLTNQNLVDAGGADGAVSLHLKYLNVAEVTQNKMAAYYPGTNRSTAGKGIRITSGFVGKVCNIDTSRVRASDELYVRITVKELTSETNLVQNYGIPIRQVCDTNNFYGHTFPLPNGRLQIDPSGYLRARIVIGFRTNGPPLNDTIGYDLNYNVRLVGTGSSDASGARLALLSNDSSNEFGMRSGYATTRINEANNRRVKIAVPFGYPCGETPLAPQREVKLYDADSAFGDTFMWVTKNNRKLAQSDYVAVRNIDRWVGADSWWKLKGSNNDENILRLVASAVEPGAEYKLHILNTGKDGNVNSGLNPHNNTLSVSIPNDSIYADVNCDFGLVPGISVSPPAYVATPSLTVNGWIDNTDPGGITGNHVWQIWTVKYTGEPGLDLEGTKNTNGDACSLLNTAITVGGSCVLYRPATYPANDRSTSTYNGASPDPLGTYTCFITRVKDPTSAAGDDDQWLYSDLACSVAGELPWIQVLGHDARVLGMIDTSRVTAEGKTYGSWGEYGVFSGGQNYWMGSGKGLYKGAGSPNQANWSDLTFSNTPGPEFGIYDGLVDEFDENQYRPFDQNEPGDYTFTGNGGKIEYGPGNNTELPRQVIRIHGTAYINADLIYKANGGGFANYTDIPQVIIIADNVVIDGSVGRIDPWIVALEDADGNNGNISTCAQATDPQGEFLPFTDVRLTTGGACGSQLEFNSPVYASHLFLYRTYGNYNNRPAEIFRLRGDVFMSALPDADDNPIATTDIITELPPRF